MNCPKAVKKIFAFSFASLVAAAAFAVDFGGSLKNVTSFKGNKFDSLKLDQTDDLALWLKVPFTKSGSVYLIAEGLYEFEYDQSQEEAFNRLDLDLFKFSAKFNLKDGASANLSAGRFMFSDLTGLIFNQNGDGLYFDYNNSFLSLSAYGSYTGLLNANLVKMLDAPYDPFDGDAKAVYKPAQKNAVAAATVSFPRLWQTQNLSAQFLGAFKVDSKSLNRMYLSLSLSGPVYKTLYYNASSTLGMLSYNGGSVELSNLSSLRFSFFFPVKDLTLNLGGLYASGSNGPFESFMAVTKISAFNALDDTAAQHTGLVKGSFSASIKPLKVLLLYAGCDVILDAATSSVQYRGFQYNAGVDCQIFSDVKIGAGLLQYFDDLNSDNDKVQISLNALIVF